MRSALLLAAAVAACASPAPVTPAPCEPACAGGAVCIEGVCYSPADAGAEGGAVDAAADLQPDAGAEAGADVQGLDGAAVMDAGRDAAPDLQLDAGPDAPACRPGFADCDDDPSNGCEVDTSSSAVNCGRCGNRCDSSSACVGGTCVVWRGPGCPAGCTTNADCAMCSAPGGPCCYGGRCRMLLRCP